MEAWTVIRAWVEQCISNSFQRAKWSSVGFLRMFSGFRVQRSEQTATSVIKVPLNMSRAPTAALSVMRVWGQKGFENFPVVYLSPRRRLEPVAANPERGTFFQGTKAAVHSSSPPGSAFAPWPLSRRHVCPEPSPVAASAQVRAVLLPVYPGLFTKGVL